MERHYRGPNQIGKQFLLCSHAHMMIRPDDEELRCAIEIALHTAKPYALRGVFTETRALDREVAVRTLSQRIMAALRRYEIMREPNAYEQGDRTLPLFPDEKVGAGQLDLQTKRGWRSD